MPSAPSSSTAARGKPPDSNRGCNASGKRPAEKNENGDEVDDGGDSEGTGPRAVSLGSRKQLCINEHLRGRAGDLDEACRQMLGGDPLYLSLLLSVFDC